MILDGTAVVQMQNCGTTRTFKDYGELVFALYISAQLEKCNRVDLVWDVYVLASLKASTRQKRGKGTRKRVAASTVMPKNWNPLYVSMRTKLNCLRSCHPKQFAFTWYLLLADRKELYATDGSHIDSCLAHLAPCSQEADTRLPLHAADAMQKGCKKVDIRTVDTDVLVLDAASFSKTGPDERWVTFGVGTNYQYIAAHEMVATMTPTKCLSLPVLHAFTGCDTVSSFASKAKKTAWETWKSFSEVNGAFKELQCMPGETSNESMELLERFMVLMYNRTSEATEVNDTRRQLFTQKSRTLENIPPTQAALKQHINLTC